MAASPNRCEFVTRLALSLTGYAPRGKPPARAAKDSHIADSHIADSPIADGHIAKDE
jgi:hypothetical protein